MRYSVIIPAYNEATTIARAIQETDAVLSSLPEPNELIVVDDGSQDKTSEIVTQLQSTFPRLRLINLNKNQGKGRAVQAGIMAAQGEYIGFLDADLATHPRTFITAFKLLEDTDIAIGSRRVSHAKISRPQAWHRSKTGQLFNKLVRFWFSLPYQDTQCGCKVFRASIAKQLFSNLQTAGWTFDVEIIYHARTLGYRIQEFPVDWKNGLTSRVHWHEVIKILKELANIKKHVR